MRLQLNMREMLFLILFCFDLNQTSSKQKYRNYHYQYTERKKMISTVNYVVYYIICGEML